jgi:hypothetical protein
MYVYDTRGIKNLINPENETTCMPCEPWCTTCKYPIYICDPFWTKCTGTKLGRWFNESQDKWIEAETETETEHRVAPDVTPDVEQKEAYGRWSQHKFGLCVGCKVGLDDKSDFTINYSFSSEHGIMMCHACDERNKQQFHNYCTNCFNSVNDGDVIIGSVHPKSRRLVVTFCRKC